MSTRTKVTAIYMANEGPNAGESYLMRFDLSDGRAIWVGPLLFGDAQIIIGRQEDYPRIFDDCFYYSDPLVALYEAMVWGMNIDTIREPAGWYRNPTTRRHRENGDPATEYILD